MQVDFGAGPESDHNIHLTSHAHAHPHFEHSSHAGSSFSSFRHAAAPPMDPAIDQSANPSRNNNSNSHLLQPDNAALNSPHHLTHPFYADMSRASQTPSTPSNSSPRFSNISPAPPQPKQLPATSYVPTDRPAPSRHVSDDTLDEAFAAFILYCNPNFATEIDTTELIRQFRTPPKSDGKAFSTWSLFELIRKFDAKEIKTWTQLALDLGVEPPDTDKGQSTQKVQQYSVRLKRWMRAMHIDAFFEYMLGKQHQYYLQIPPPHDPFPEDGRDGVPLGEDLAIRALDPKYRPKRGRRKADEGDDELDMVDAEPPRKRPQLDTSIPFGNVLQPQSAYPSSAHPDNMDGFLGANDPWATSGITPSSAMTPSPIPGRMNTNKNLTPYSASPMSGQHIRWRVNTQDNPTTPHPLSAVTPQSAHPDYFDEPQSAITPSSSSKPRARRRHGPAVSSAWPSNNTSSTGKLRGRPPSNRSVRDGPFVTFPANPKTKEGPPIEMNRTTGTLTPIVERAQSDPPVDQQQQQQHFRFPPTPASAVSPTTIDSQLQQSAQRPHRLSLQVPKNVGNPVHLVTPTVLVTGEEDHTPSTAMTSSTALSTDSPFLRHEQSLRRNQQTPQSRSHTSAPSPYHASPSSSSVAATTTQTHPTSAPPQSSSQKTSIATSNQTSLPSLPPESLNRALVAEIIRAPLSGRRKRLRGHEAKNLAAAILHPVLSSPSPNTNTRPQPHPLLALTLASCLGLASGISNNNNNNAPGTGNGNSNGSLASLLGPHAPKGGIRKIECVRFRVGRDGYESPLDEDDSDDDGPATNEAARDADIASEAHNSNKHSSSTTRRGAGSRIRESFDIFFSVAFGGASTSATMGSGLTGEWVVRGLSRLPVPSPSSGATTVAQRHVRDDDDGDLEFEGDGDDGDDDDAEVWKARFLEARRRLREKSDEVRAVRDRVLDAALLG
ncbi:unnamed protein product [Periconia digitata]|uniref:Uncharacterized protein n=1 Tax=Periconia digitata TaxID=1303443 RepID=A0A9W4UB73_9PLEO|nr:unnamed protein product [Periconia digitata]